MWIYGLIGLSIYFSLEWLSVKLLCFPSNDVLITIIDRNVQLKIAFDLRFEIKWLLSFHSDRVSLQL